MKNKITDLILRLGIPSTRQGYRYLCRALELCLENEDYLLSVYKTLYVDVAKYYSDSRDNVEHSMRTAINHCWNYGNRELLIKITKYPLTKRPTTGEFLDILYHHLTS